MQGIRALHRNGLQGRKAISPGHRPGYRDMGKFALKGQKLYPASLCFCPCGSANGRDSFVVVMPVASEHKDKNFVFKDAIHQTVLLRNLAAPSAFRQSLQRLRVSKPGLGMLLQFLYEAYCFGKDFWLAPFQLCQPFASFGGEINTVHQSPLLLSISDTDSPCNKRTHFPCLYSSSPRSRLAINSSFVTSVWSSFLATSFRRYLPSCFISGSLSAISAMSRSICAFNCNAVIVLTFLWFPRAKVRRKNERMKE